MKSIRFPILLICTLAFLSQVQAASPNCGGENAFACNNGCPNPGQWVYNFCDCCPNGNGTCGNCVWHAWQMACCNWGVGLPWCSWAASWLDQAQANGYATGATSQSQSIFVCTAHFGSCSQADGHVGWVVTANPDGSFDSTEQDCYSNCGQTPGFNRPAGFATGYIYSSQSCTTDADQDSYISNQCPGGDDCNDNNAGIHPGADEICGNGIDEDCNGQDPPCGCTTDADQDGYVSDQCPGGNDCNDNNGNIHPGAQEICGDGIDQDCAGGDLPCGCTTDNDQDGYVSNQCPGGNDCNDSDGNIHPGAPSTCGNQVDEDCDGADPSCPTGDVSFSYAPTSPCQGHSVTIVVAGHSGHTNVVLSIRAPDGSSVGNNLTNIDGSCNGSPNTLCQWTYSAVVNQAGNHSLSFSADPGNTTYGTSTQSVVADVDGDGVCPPEDCNDNNNAILPGAAEACGNNVDDDCDSSTDEDCPLSEPEAGADSYDGASADMDESTSIADGDAEAGTDLPETEEEQALSDYQELSQDVVGGCACFGVAGGADILLFLAFVGSWIVARAARTGPRR